MDNLDWQEEITSKYPLLYKHRSFFECHSGWAKLIDELSSSLEAEIKGIEIEEDDLFGLPYMTQCKEKFGKLRFYISHGTDYMHEMIEEAERLSGEICELCSSPGIIRCKNRWYSCRCDACWMNLFHLKRSATR